MIFTPRLNQALQFSARAHAPQKRTGTTIPYFTHPVAVALILSTTTSDEDVLVAALLHDVVEDCPDPDFGAGKIKEVFGERVFSFVLGCTERELRNVDWKVRKDSYVENLDSAPEESLLIVAADKIHNLLSILEDHKNLGEKVFDKFNASKAETMWFYRETFGRLEKRLEQDNALLERYLEKLEELEGKVL